jgi:hypothetical protein
MKTLIMIANMFTHITVNILKSFFIKNMWALASIQESSLTPKRWMASIRSQPNNSHLIWPRQVTKIEKLWFLILEVQKVLCHAPSKTLLNNIKTLTISIFLLIIKISLMFWMKKLAICQLILDSLQCAQRVIEVWLDIHYWTW